MRGVGNKGASKINHHKTRELIRRYGNSSINVRYVSY